MTTKVDRYFERDGDWRPEARRLRQVLLACGLDEALKWGKPCYMAAGGNIAILQTFNDFLALLFFKGALLSDPDQVLESQGKNTRSALRVCFRSTGDVERLESVVKRLVADAIEVERKGLKVEGEAEIEICDELAASFDDEPELKAAFDGLTPGRQREYCLHFNDAKKSETRANRIAKVRDKILAGKGLRD